VAQIRETSAAPADLSFLGGPPGSFWKQVQGRFAAQKALTPERPYSFPMPELGRTVTFLRLIVAERLSRYGRGRGVLWRPMDRRNDRLYRALGLRAPRARLYADLRAERELLRLVLRDLDQLDEHAPQYDELLRLSYFGTRAMALTAERKQFWTHRFLDLAQETATRSPAEELRAYRQGAHPFDTEPNWLSRRFVYGRRAELFPPDAIDLVLLPVVGRLSLEPFIRHRNEPVHFMSIIEGTLKADGWRMNPHQLAVHDYHFHAAQKARVDERFAEEHRLSEAQRAELSSLQRRWFERLFHRIEAEPDAKLRAALREMTSYVLHDRPRPFFPDSFLSWDAIMITAKVRHRIADQLHQDGISDRLGENLVYNARAVAWLRRFWREPEIENEPLVRRLRAQRIVRRE
jgi:hypothetical protein